MKEIKWNYHSPKFECDTYNLEMMKYSLQEKLVK